MSEPTETTEEKPEATVKTVVRAADLLRALAAHRDGAMLSAVARETGLGKGTVHRLLGALIDTGFVFQEPESRRYRLGAGLMSLAREAHQHEVAALARPSMLRLAEITGDTIYCSIPEGLAAVCIAREIGSFPIRTLSLEVGHLRPLGVGSGSLALLAVMPDDQIEQIVSRNEAWLARYPGHDREQLRLKVARTRRNGYSFVDGKIISGMNAIGVPVLDSARRPIAALSLAAITERVRGDRIAVLVGLLREEAGRLARILAVTEPPAAARAPAR